MVTLEYTTEQDISVLYAKKSVQSPASAAKIKENITWIGTS